MFGDDELLISILNGAAEKSLEKIKKEGNLTLEDAIPLLLKGQYNHILHLDKEITEIKKRLKNTATKNDIRNMATKDDIRNMVTKDDIKILKWVLGIGLGFISIVLAILTGVSLFK